MSEAANVKSIDAVTRFKAAAIEFKELCRRSLDEADADVGRLQQWIVHEQPSHWRHQGRKASEKLAQAKSELHRAQLARPDQRPSTFTDEIRAVDKAKRQMAHVQECTRQTKRWSRLIEREVLLFKGQCQHLSSVLDGNLVKGIARLDTMVTALEQYVRTTTPRFQTHDTLDGKDELGTSLRRSPPGTPGTPESTESAESADPSHSQHDKKEPADESELG